MPQVGSEPGTTVRNEQLQVHGEQPLAGQVALVTGSGRGLGRAIAEHLARLGADIAIHDISDTAPAQYGEAATLAETAQRLLGPTGRGVAVTGDITDELAVKQILSAPAQTPISVAAE